MTRKEALAANSRDATPDSLRPAPGGERNSEVRPVPSSATDPLDAYLSELGTAHPLSREAELDAARRIDAAERAVFDVVIDSGIPLPEVLVLGQEVKEGHLEAEDVAECGERTGERGRRWLTRRIGTIRRLEREYQSLWESLDQQPTARKREAVQAQIEENRAERSEVLRGLGLHRSRFEKMVTRVRDALHERTRAERAISEARRNVGGLTQRQIRAAVRRNQGHGRIDAHSLAVADEAIRESREVVDRVEHELARPPSVLRSTERRLQQAVRRADQAKAELTQANLRLVVSYAKKHKGRGVPLSDLIQEGNLALMRAADKYDHRVGTRFSTYAAWWIRQAMTRALIGQGGAIRLPVHKTEAVQTTQRVSRKLAHELGREPTVEEIAEAMDETPERVRERLEVSTWTVSLEQPAGHEDDRQVGELLADDDAVSADEAVIDADDQDRALKSLNVLTPRERRILQMRFGMDGERDHTLQEIGNDMGLSRERIRQLEAEALSKLRRALVESEPRRAAG